MLDLIDRPQSVITGKENVEDLYTLKNFPVFMGCTEKPESEDMKADMAFGICKDTGIIQLKKLLPLEHVYQNQHNDGTGKVWQEHYASFASFVKKYSPKHVLEIGGATDRVANLVLENTPEISWTILEPHPLFQEKENITLIQGWFDESFTTEENFDTIVHSHVLEHTYDPQAFIRHIADSIPKNGKHIFTFPNMVEQLSRKYTNCLNFEHTCFLAEPFVDYLLAKHGFEIMEKEYFQDHSIFYATRLSSDPTSKSPSKLINKYKEYKELFLNFTNYHEQLTAELNDKISRARGEVFLFGAHIFSQYLLAFGLKENNIAAILDNSPIKQGKRLYGTNLMVFNPEMLRTSSNPTVILKVGAYRDEITEQIKKINQSVEILE